MALESTSIPSPDYSEPPASATPGASGGSVRSATDAAPPVSKSSLAWIISGLANAFEAFKRQPFARFFTNSLRRRILLTNLVGLSGLLLAMLYLSLHHGWLLDAKVDIVKTISRITSEAIAYRAVNDRAVFDANRLPERAAAKVQRDDAFAALELPIDPQQAALVLKKLVGPANLKARVYTLKGSLILDSDTLFSKDVVTPQKPAAMIEEAPRLKNFWTRFHYWMINRELKVYRELGTANGFLYPEVRRAAEQGVETPILLLNGEGEQIVSMAEPIKRGNKVLGVLFLSTQPGDIDDVLWDERWLTLQIAGVALLAAIASSLLLARTVAGPMKRLSEAAKHVSQNIAARRELPDYSDRRDEVGQMSRAFTDMTGALYRRIEASEKFAADVAHELKNPLAAARSTAEALTYAKTEDDRNTLVSEIQSELKRLNRLINDVSSASRLDAELARQEMEPLDITDVLRGVTSIFKDSLESDTRKISLETERPINNQRLMVVGNDIRIAQVFTNLADNALSFSPENGTVTIRAKRVGKKIEVSVEDEGPGIPSDKLEQIFDRFYSDRPETDRKTGKNSGLGLSISREIVLSHRGEIVAENRAALNGSSTPAGARFIVRFPAATDEGGYSGRRD